MADFLSQLSFHHPLLTSLVQVKSALSRHVLKLTNSDPLESPPKRKYHSLISCLQRYLFHGALLLLYTNTHADSHVINN